MEELGATYPGVMTLTTYLYCINRDKLSRYMEELGVMTLTTYLYCINRDELSRYMEELGATCPGVMTLTTYLSRPFQQIERYSLLLKELERHSEVRKLMYCLS